MTTITRRQFLKLSAAAAGGALLPRRGREQEKTPPRPGLFPLRFPVALVPGKAR